MLTKEQQIQRGVFYGILVWMIFAILSPILMELSQLILDLSLNWNKIGKLFQQEPLIYLFVIISVFINFLIPCLLGGVVLGFVGTKKIIAKTPVGPFFFGLVITILGCGSYWLFFLTERERAQGEGYWVVGLLMLGMHTILWALAINRFNLWVTKNSN